MVKCGIFQQVKVEHQKSVGPLQPLLIPEWKWEMITMYFVSGLPREEKRNDVIWVIVDCLTKSVLFLVVKLCEWGYTTSWDSNIHCLRSGS